MEDRDVFITHLFRAKPEVLYAAWTNPDFLERWFAPDGCTITIRKMDARKGGSFHYCIKNPKFHDCWCIGEYLEMNRPTKIVYAVEIADEFGKPARPVDQGMDPEWPQRTIVTVTFSEHDGGTKITLHQTVAERIAKRTGAHPSWIQMLARLESETQKTNGIAI